MNNLVTIITPSYNSSRFISQTIASVIQQTYKNWEMLIIDDDSSDNSLEIINEYLEKDKRIKLIRLKKNSGPAMARNEGIKAAKGKYIAFLDSDDMWLPTKLERQISFMERNKLAITYSSYYTINENGKRINLRKAKEKISYKYMLRSNHIGNLTGIFDQELIGKFYMENTGHEDYTLWLKIMKKVKKTQGITEPLAEYRILFDSVSSNKFKVLFWQWKIYRKVLGLNLIISIYYFAFYIYYGLKKRL